jgi:hypothetical protein
MLSEVKRLKNVDLIQQLHLELPFLHATCDKSEHFSWRWNYVLDSHWGRQQY